MIACPLCSRDFVNLQALNQHLRTSREHASCGRCQRGFVSGHALQLHLQNLSKHKPPGQSAHAISKIGVPINSQCRRISIPLLPQTLQILPHVPVYDLGYTGVPSSEIDSVYKLACKLLSCRPSPDMIIYQTQTKLSRDIVCAMIDATDRLLPLDHSPRGVKARQLKQNERTEKALLAEQRFGQYLKDYGYLFLDESQQRQQQAGKVTPDFLFPQPNLINGHLCMWVEYKDYLGFRSNPYVASHDKKQFKKYSAGIGSGAVVYRLGFEAGYPAIEGVKVFREQEVLRSLTIQY